MDPNDKGGTPSGDTPAPNSNDNNGGQPNPNPAGNGDGGAAQLTDDQLKLAFEHPRFKELTQAASELKKLKDKQAADEQKRLEEQGEHQKLAEQYKGESESWKSKYETSLKTNAIIVEANKLGAHDANTVAKLVDGNSVTIKEDGTVEGVAEAIAALQTANPYLFKTGSSTKIGGGDTNPNGGSAAEFTASQYQDATFYQKNQAAMDKAMVEGRVDMTK